MKIIKSKLIKKGKYQGREKEYKHDWYLDNKIRILRLRKKYYIENKEKCNQQCKTYRLKNQEHYKIYRKKWIKKQPWGVNYNTAQQRCENFKNDSYRCYGARGIKMLMSRKEFHFLWLRDRAYLLKRPSIDRIDNDGNYELDNCRYIELRENSKRRYNASIK